MLTNMLHMLNMGRPIDPELLPSTKGHLLMINNPHFFASSESIRIAIECNIIMDSVLYHRYVAPNIIEKIKTTTENIQKIQNRYYDIYGAASFRETLFAHILVRTRYIFSEMETLIGIVAPSAMYINNIFIITLGLPFWGYDTDLYHLFITIFDVINTLTELSSSQLYAIRFAEMINERLTTNLYTIKTTWDLYNLFKV